MKKMIKKMFFIFAAAVLVSFAGKADVQAASYNVNVVGTQNDYVAYQVLEEINEQRIANNLGTLTMDETLMESAMQRAAELSVYMGHTRPNNTSWNTISSECSGGGENAACGQTSASEVVTDWMNSTGHRENILNSSWKYTGIGLFYNNGMWYWIQLFSSQSLTAASWDGTYGTTVVRSISVDSSLLNMAWKTTEDYFLEYGTTDTLVRVIQRIDTTNVYSILDNSTFSWSSSNPNVISVDDTGKITGKGCGTATITATLKSNTSYKVTREITCAKSISKAEITGVYEKYPYTGLAIEPASDEEFSITYNGTPLVEGTDYTVSYENNTNTSLTWAYMYITGMGDYSGTLTKQFSVEKLTAKDNTIAIMEDREKRADESAADYVASILTLKLDDRVLVLDRDYYIRSSSYMSAEESSTGVPYYSFTVHYAVGYGGSSEGFQSLGAYKINPIADQTYSGSAVTPIVSITSDVYSTRGITEGEDYTVTYSNNVNVGTATVTVTGTGKYYLGSISRTFKIVKPSESSNSGGTANITNPSDSTVAATIGSDSPSNTPRVSFSANGGTSSTSTKYYTKGYTVGTLPTATRKGYTFAGWYTSPTGGQKVANTSVVAGNATVYARWTKVSVGKTIVKKITVGKKQVKVTLKKVSGAKGYQIRYSTKKNMKSAKKVNITTLTRKIKKLKKGKRYYIQVRAYKKDSTGGKVYGSWSVKKRSKKVK